jgi:hypothetical protein
MAKKKNVLTDLQIKEAEEGRQPQSKAETLRREREAIMGTATEKSKAISDYTREELDQIAAGERYLRKGRKK